jgi:uncharacterized membrane protein YedE/YeeE
MGMVYVLFGAAFGFALSRARATDPDAIAGMFRLQDLHLMGVIVVAIAVSALGLAVVRRRARRPALAGCAMEVTPKPFHSGVVPGGLLFGAGWALSGTCPGTALAQPGELKSYAVFTIAGILLGTWVYGAMASRAKPAETRTAAHAHSAGHS